MALKVCRNRRAVAVLFLLCLMAWAQTVALFGVTETHHSAGHCCPLCHLGSLPFLYITNAASVAPVAIVERFLSKPDFEASHDVLLTANSSRAPPGISSIA
jgi:hypothetical protein